jgi:hypothetical protein
VAEEIDEPQERVTGTAARIDLACYRFMTDPALAPLRAWWEGEVERVALPPGPVDRDRLVMAQGDRERRLSIMSRAERHRVSKGET